MKRRPSAGVMTAAIVLLAACGLLLLGMLPPSAGHGFGSAYLNRISQGQGLVFFAWGIATGIGLLFLRPWARASILLMSLYGICDDGGELATFLGFFFWHPAASDTHGLQLRHAFVSTIYNPLVPFLAYIWWLVYFSRRSVGRQFEPGAIGEGNSAHSRTLPLSVWMVVIGLLVCAASAAPWVLALNFGFPRFYFGRRIPGSIGWGIDIALMLVAPVLGVAMWRKQRWAHIGAMVFCVILIANAGSTAVRVLTGFVRHYPTLHSAVMARTRSLAEIVHAQFPFMSAMWPVIALWILWSRREAFAPPQIVSGAAEESNEGGKE